MESDQTQDRVAEISRTIKAEMGRRSMSQTQLAAKVGISQVAISKKLRCVSPLSVAELLDIADALGVAAADLLKDAA